MCENINESCISLQPQQNTEIQFDLYITNFVNIHCRVWTGFWMNSKLIRSFVLKTEIISRHKMLLNSFKHCGNHKRDNCESFLMFLIIQNALRLPLSDSQVFPVLSIVPSWLSLSVYRSLKIIQYSLRLSQSFFVFCLYELYSCQHTIYEQIRSPCITVVVRQ